MALPIINQQSLLQQLWQHSILSINHPFFTRLAFFFITSLYHFTPIKMRTSTIIATLLTTIVAVNGLDINWNDDDRKGDLINFDDGELDRWEDHAHDHDHDHDLDFNWSSNKDNDHTAGKDKATSCECDISKCPSGEKACDCITGLMDKCYNDQMNAGLNCGVPKYPQGCEGKDGGKDSITKDACGGKTGQKCGAGKFCFFPDRSCDPRGTECSGMCAKDYCGGRHNKECPDDRWTCVYDDACERNGDDDCEGKCVLN